MCAIIILYTVLLGVEVFVKKVIIFLNVILACTSPKEVDNRTGGTIKGAEQAPESPPALPEPTLPSSPASPAQTVEPALPQAANLKLKFIRPKPSSAELEAVTTEDSHHLHLCEVQTKDTVFFQQPRVSYIQSQNQQSRLQNICYLL